MRWVQNAALFGLIGGSVLLAYGIDAGNTGASLLGIGLGMLLGLPAAYIHFVAEGYAFDVRAMRVVRVVLPSATTTKREQSDQGSAPNKSTAPPKALSPNTAPPVEIIKARHLTSEEKSSHEIPVRVVHEEKATPPPVVKVPIRIEGQSTTEESPPTASPALEKSPPPPPGLSSAERQALIDRLSGESSLDGVLHYTTHEDTLVRLYAVQRLGNLGDSQAEKNLRQALDDPEDIVKRAARLALDKLDLEV